MAEVDAGSDEGRAVTWGMGDAVLGNVASLVLSVLTVGVAFAISGDETLDDLPLWATAMLQVPLWAGLLGAVVLASRRKGHGSLRTDFGLAMQARDIPVGLVGGVVAQWLGGLAVYILYDLLGVDSDKVGETAERLADRATSGVDITLFVLIVVVCAPLVEEIFYRGLWLRSIERRTGSRVAAIVGSSVVFGAVHFQLYDTVALVLAGLVFAWLAARYGRLGPAIWAHVGFNLTAVVALL